MSTTIVSRHASQDTPAIGRKISGINCFSHENFKNQNCERHQLISTANPALFYSIFMAINGVKS